MRLTRAALRAEAHEIDSETADASHPHTEPQERVPLGEVSPNTTVEPEIEELHVAKMPAKKAKAKGGAKKGAKGKKGKNAEDEVEVVEVVEVLEDERSAAASPAGDEAVDELAKDTADGAYQD
jgi:hypothetical protein